MMMILMMTAVAILLEAAMMRQKGKMSHPISNNSSNRSLSESLISIDNRSNSCIRSSCNRLMKKRRNTNKCTQVVVAIVVVVYN